MKLFQLNPPPKIKKSTFDLSHERKTTLTMGKLTPIYVEEVVPGDYFRIETQHMLRLAPMLAPLFHRLDVYVHFFFVPNRIIWSGWEDFITGKVATSVPTETIPATIPVGSLQDHMGMPTGSFNVPDVVNVLPFYAYVKIWNDYYRNQHLQAEIDWTAIDNVLNSEDLDLLDRNWEKDYFTSCLPTAQDGDPVTVPVDIEYLSKTALRKSADGTDAVAGTMSGRVDTGETVVSTNSESLYVDNIDEATVDIQELRYAVRLQKWAERQIRSGNRYIETILSHFGVQPADYRLQRAEYLGGGKSPVVVSEVINQTGEAGGLPQGHMVGHGISVGNSNVAVANIKEHGYIMGIMSVIPTTLYSQGIPKMFDRTVPTDFYWPEFAQLGEQEVLQREIYLDPDNNPSNNTVFGYQSRYAEYKYKPSSVHGEFRDTLNYWHLGREFASAPSLNDTFVICTPRFADIFASGYNEHLWVNIYNKVIATRPMPFFNEPRL